MTRNRFRRTIGTAGALGVLLSGLWATGASTAGAATVTCGSTITQSTTLSADVGPCPGDGIIVGRSGVRLNLNGFTVLGNAAEDAGGPLGDGGESIGILLDNVSNVQVTNGTVRDFEAGVFVNRGSRNRISGITARDNVRPSLGEDFTSQSGGNLGDGIVLFSSVGNVVEKSTAESNGPFSGIALLTDSIVGTPQGPLVANNIVRDNIVRNNNTAFGDIGIRIEGPGANNNLIQRNTVTGSGLEGIGILAVNNVRIMGAFTDPPTCSNRGQAGLPPEPRPDLPPCPTKNPPNPNNRFNTIQGNTVNANSVLPNQRRPGIAVIVFCIRRDATSQPGALNGTDNLITGNTANNNGGSGIAMGGQVFSPALGGGPCGAENNRILGNTALNNNVQQPVLAPGTAPGGITNPAGGADPNGRSDLFDGFGLDTRTRCTVTPGPGQSCAQAGGQIVPIDPNTFGQPQFRPCDNNKWENNTFGTAFPPCAAGRRGRSAGPTAAPNAAGASPQATSDSPAAVDDGGYQPGPGNRAFVGLPS